MLKAKDIEGALLFAHRVSDPSAYGVVEFPSSSSCQVISIEEKLNEPESNHAVPDPNFYDKNVIEVVKNVVPNAW